MVSNDHGGHMRVDSPHRNWGDSPICQHSATSQNGLKLVEWNKNQDSSGVDTFNQSIGTD